MSNKMESSCADAEGIFILLSQLLTHPIIAGILLAAILSAIMSTIDSQLLVSSSALAGDIYKGLFRKEASNKEQMFIARLSIILIAIIALFLGRDPKALSLISSVMLGLDLGLHLAL